MPQLGQHDLLQSSETVDMQIMLTVEEVHGKQQAHEPEIVITMKVAYENMIDLVCALVIFSQLKLTTLPAIKKKVTVLNNKMLR